MRNLTIVVIGLLVIALLVYIGKSRPKSSPKSVQPTPLPTLMLFYAPWCGYCTKFQPEWEQIKLQLQSAPIQVVDINGDVRKDLMEKYQIPGFPSLLIETADGRVFPYDGERTASAVLNFVSRFLD